MSDDILIVKILKVLSNKEQVLPLISLSFFNGVDVKNPCLLMGFVLFQVDRACWEKLWLSVSSEVRPRTTKQSVYYLH